MSSGLLKIQSKANLGWITTIAFLCLFLLGLMDNLKGATLPAVLAELNFSDAQGGTVLLWAYIGFLTAALLVGVLSDVAGNRAVVLAATACLLLGTLGYSLSSRLGLLSVSMGVLGIGLGGVDMAGYLIIVAYYKQNKGRYLNLTAFFHGLASTIAPYYAGLLLAVGISWRQIYQYPLAIVLLTLALGLVVRFPKLQVEHKSRMDFRAVGKVVFQPVMGWYFALMILYVAAEIGVASWIVIYLQRIHGLEITASAAFLSLYFAGIMLGRLIGTVFVDKVGYLRSILIMTICAAVCLALGIFGPGRSYWLLPLTGLFFSIIFPTLTAAVTDRVTGNVGTVMGLLFAFCGIGGALGPWLVGMVSELAGIRAGFAVNLASTVIMAAIALVLVRLTSRPARPVKSMAQ
jgi:MFS transporter, FHS family, glucose/mannose:H+ symporter